MSTRSSKSARQRIAACQADQYPLALGVEGNKPAKIQQLEGTVTRIPYLNPKGRSGFEIYRNYEDALSKAGFQRLWTCAATTCGQGIYWNALNGLTAN